MELLLNLSWLAASVALGILLLRSRGRREAASAEYVYSHSAAWISYLILIAMLLPVISMTDDLQAMVTPTDGEQIVRRLETSIPGHFPVPLHGAVFFPVRGSWFAPIPDNSLFEVGLSLCPSDCLYRSTTQGRAPPIAG